MYLLTLFLVFSFPPSHFLTRSHPLFLFLSRIFPLLSLFYPILCIHFAVYLSSFCSSVSSFCSSVSSLSPSSSLCQFYDLFVTAVLLFCPYRDVSLHHTRKTWCVLSSFFYVGYVVMLVIIFFLPSDFLLYEIRQKVITGGNVPKKVEEI